MTRALDPVMKELRDKILLMGSRAEDILEKAIRALIERNYELAAEVAPDDLVIDRLDVEIDNAVLRALALQAPVAADLRTVVAIKMIAADLERIGDLSRNIAKSAQRMARSGSGSLSATLLRLARASQEMLRSALDAFSRVDGTAARSVLARDDELDLVQDEVVRHELEQIARHPDFASEAVDVILVAKSLERVGDHATNIAEDVILMAEARNVKHAAKLAEGR